MKSITQCLILGSFAVGLGVASQTVYANIDVIKSSIDADAQQKVETELTSLKDINQADEKSLKKVGGIGKQKAQSIVEYRKKHGPFHSLSELKKVKGVSPKIIKRLEKYFKVEITQ